MAKKGKRIVERNAPVPSLSIASDVGRSETAPWLTFPGEVVRSYRHMLARLTRTEALPSRLALVSTLREEGVTYSALALGTVLAADTAVSVCVVELNWHWPGQQTLLADVTSPGLAGVLAEEASLDEALVQTHLPNLALLPAGEMEVGKRPYTARSSQLKLYLDELGKRYDHLLLDTPAILATSDAIPLASLSNGSCLVIKQGVTSIENTKRALDDIAHLHILGVILNQVIVKTPKLFLKYIPQE
ncbi:MAG: CpsD/CapB family tyrosine-protein kinase [Ardenticatenaceae bacterium]|nr:CpsD/CapB family tyrosine-protein kinase [Ardenticatenaceae bacterium]